MDKKPFKGERQKTRRSRRAKDRHFMDAALDAYIRDQALLLWRDFVVYRDRDGQPVAEAARLTGFFGDRGDYAPLWLSAWERIVLGDIHGDDGTLYGQIEAAVREAVLAEKGERIAKGDATMEDTDDYNQFIRQVLGRLLTDAAGEKDAP